MYFNVSVIFWVLIYSIALLCFMIVFALKLTVRRHRSVANASSVRASGCDKERMAATTKNSNELRQLEPANELRQLEPANE